VLIETHVLITLTWLIDRYRYVNTSSIDVAQAHGEAGKLSCTLSEWECDLNHREEGPTSSFAPFSNGVANKPLGSLA
jgi:hypothetical protein